MAVHDHDIQGFKEGFTDPFRYVPHPLVRKAADIVMKRIQEYKPEACAYLAEDTLNLLSEDHHELDRSEYPNIIVTYVHMSGFDGGDW